jgi:uncharacterized membrane protein
VISNSFVAVLLSVVFVATAAYSTFQMVRSRPVRDRVSYAFHTLMSAAMFCMIWPWGVELFLVPQIVIFSAATIWFVILAVTPATAEGHLATGHHDGPRKLLYHGGMMAAMVVMAFGMIGMSSGAMSMPSSMEMGAMPGMDMSGGGGGMVAPLWIGIASLVLGIGFGIAALYFLGSGLAVATSGEGPAISRRRGGADAGWNLLMAAGMAALFIPMISFG